MPKKQETTPKSRVRSSLRMLFLRSRERAAVLKREKNTCQKCGAKASSAKGREVKVEVHHRDGIDWTVIVERVFSEILVHPDKMVCLCKDCHVSSHGKNSCE